MSTLGPDGLDSQTNAQLNELFAVTYGGWTQVPLIRGDKTNGVIARFQRPAIYREGHQPYLPSVIKRKGSYGGDLWPDYCADANAVLPWLERWSLVDAIRLPTGHWHIGLNPGEATYSAESPTFARAAVIALIRAARAAKNTVS